MNDKAISREGLLPYSAQSRMVEPNVLDLMQRSRAREEQEIALVCAEVYRLLDELRAVFVNTRSLDVRVRRAVRAKARQRLGYAAADASWFLLHELSDRDAIVFEALRHLSGGIGGEPFHVTIAEIHAATRGPIGYSTVGASLHRLHHLGLIRYEPRRGKYGSLVTLL